MHRQRKFKDLTHDYQKKLTKAQGDHQPTNWSNFLCGFSRFDCQCEEWVVGHCNISTTWAADRPITMIEDADLHTSKKMLVEDELVTQLWIVSCVHQGMISIAPVPVFIAFYDNNNNNNKSLNDLPNTSKRSRKSQHVHFESLLKNPTMANLR